MMLKDTVIFRNKKFYSKNIGSYEGKRNIDTDNKIYESKYSAVYKEGMNIYKTVKVSSYFRDNFRLLTTRSKSYDEIKGNHFLKQLGINVHNIKYWGISPMSHDVNELLITEYLKDYLPVEHHTIAFREKGVLEKILIQIANDINTMASNGVIYRDLHFQNVMSKLNGQICWIDTGLKYLKSKNKINKKLQIKINVIKRDMFDTGLLSANEWNSFYDTLSFGKQ